MFWESCIKKSADSEKSLSADQCYVFHVFCMCSYRSVTESVLFLRTFDAYSRVSCLAVRAQPNLCFLYIAMDRGMEIAVSAADRTGMPS